ncbi:MAG: histidinol-phosphate transaminase, partial [Gemmatimonadota bacterium]|nr:histidinol-phosphate transaminase [Gemmatimonadota bacterium]
HGNYMIVDVGRDSRRMSGELFRRGVMVRSGSGYRTQEVNLLGNHLRVTIGKPDELEVFVNELEDILGGSSQG